MNEVEVYELNDKEYYIVDKIKHEEIEFVYFSGVDDPKDIFIKKIVIEDNRELLSGLENQDEFNLALGLFYQKNKNQF